MAKPEDFGTEACGAPSSDYCCHCYTKGAFADSMTYEEAVEANVPFWKEEGDTCDEAARARIKAVFPTLKRWKSKA